MAAYPNADLDNPILEDSLALPNVAADRRIDDRQSSHVSGAHTVVSGAHTVELPKHDERSNIGRSGQLTSDQNPELLHWRANRLLDEMMLGAIDIAANDSVPARSLTPSQVAPHFTTSQASTVQPLAQEQPNREYGRPLWADSAPNRSVENEHRPASNTQTTYASVTSEKGGDTSSVTGHYPRQTESQSEHDGGSRYAGNHDVALRADGALYAEHRSNTSSSPRSTSGSSPAKPQPRNGTEQWLFAAEQRYEQLAVRHQAEQKGNGYGYDGWSIADDTQVDPLASSMVTPHSRENNFDRLPPYGQSTYEQPKAAQSTRPSLQPEIQTDSTTRPARKNLRSNLLPRMNTLDSRAAQQEMALLQSQIESALPNGHESRVRAQHLLQKAATILSKDPTRSAEVDYYLQQVRMIVRRVQETAQWSNLYKRRLQSYLWGWLALSLVFLVSRYLYAEQLASLLARLSGQSEPGLLIYDILTIATAFFFGALGGGIGALTNVVRHVRQGYGFFDRKFGLRGLILPLMGALSGIVLCVIFGLVYALFGIEPITNFWFGLVPALLALILGASQEYFYGTVAP